MNPLTARLPGPQLSCSPTCVQRRQEEDRTGGGQLAEHHGNRHALLCRLAQTDPVGFLLRTGKGLQLLPCIWCSPHLLQVEDHPDVVLLELRHHVVLQHVVLPRPGHGQHLVADPAAVQA